MSPTIIAKSTAMCVLFLSSMTFSTFPIKLSQWFNWKSSIKTNSYVQILLCLGGGVLLCTTFLHLLPEVSENIESLTDIDFPLSELLMCCGFFIIFFVEQCVHSYIQNHQEKDTESQDYPLQNSIRGLLVVLALSVHELFEGLAVGLEESPAHVWYMFGAVSAHKLVIAFCIGVELVTSGLKTMYVIIYVFTFAVVSPIGIGIGIIVSEDGENETTNMVSIILQGLASGTLLYIVFFEILKSEKVTGIRQFCAVLIGFLIMTAITYIGEHNH